ncbi:MAG: nucleotidyltransferase domain-containing protein [Candidatus Hodarchaeales archaeon]|jgi:predicted nucleotidyltransferase
MSKFNKALTFAKSIENKQNILSIILFGSVARREEEEESDVDIAIIYNRKNQEEIRTIDSLKEEGIQIVHLSIDDLKIEEEIRDALGGDGILLYGTPINLTVEESSLKPKMVLVYNTSHLDQKSRTYLQRALYGGKSTYTTQGKKYESIFEGEVKKLGIKKLKNGVLFCDRKNAYPIIKIFKNLNVHWQEISVWAYE